MSRAIEGAGTAERTWQAWGRLERLPALDLRDCPGAVVVAPHPDDEVLGVGGTLAELAAAGRPVAVLALTDGEASHAPEVIDPATLAGLRVTETERAVGELLRDCPIDRLRLPDGRLDGHETTIQAEIEARVRPGWWCFAPLEEDGHPDHETTGRAARRACSTRGARLVEYPVWAWHWGAPDDRRIPWARARRIDLSGQAFERKARALRRFTSQIAPLSSAAGGRAILPPAVLARFERRFEVFFA